MMLSKLVCPDCRVALEGRENSCHCPRCLRDYPSYTANGQNIIDFSSLNFQECTCNRDGVTRCKINLERQFNQHPVPAENEEPATLGKKEEMMRAVAGKGNRILDLGCGEGRNARWLAEGNEIYGVDLCPKRMLLNQENAQNKGYRALMVANAVSLPFPEASFDIVVCMEVIEHVTETRQLIIEINRIMKGGGRLILSTPNLVSLGNRLGMLSGKGLRLSPISFLKGQGFYPLTSWREGGIAEKQCSFDSIRYPEQPLHLRFFTFDSLRKFLRQSGFRVQKELGVGLCSPGIDRFLGRIFQSWADDILVIAEKRRTVKT